MKKIAHIESHELVRRRDNARLRLGKALLKYEPTRELCREIDAIDAELHGRLMSFLDASPQMRRGPTRYEVAAEWGTHRLIIGYTARKSMAGLLSCLEPRRLELLHATALAPDAVTDPYGGPNPGFLAEGWKIGFTGRTERTAFSLGKELTT